MRNLNWKVGLQLTAWLAVLALLFYLLGDDRRLLPYSEFKNQVRQGHVEEITVTGNRIRGVLKAGSEMSKDESAAPASKEQQDQPEAEAFTTVLPSFEDPALMALLEEHDVKVTVEEESNSLAWLLLLLPWLLIILFMYYVRRRAQNQGHSLGGGIFGIGKSRARRYRRSTSDVTFKDVAGLDNAKKDLQEIVDYMKNPEVFAALGADVPKGVLLMGPPGTGKTLLARAVAGEANVSFFSISGSEFIEMFVGVGASRVRDMFANAKKEAPSILFIDEIDSIGRARGTGLGGGHDEREQTLNQILSEMDGFAPNQSVVVMAATNRPDVLDSALTRPGRFDRRITLDLPQKKARQQILKIHTRSVPIESGVDLEFLAARTVGFSGAELKNLINEAALLAGRKNKSSVGPREFDEARDKILLGHEREEMVSDEERKVVAYHEAGHALVAKLLPGTDPLNKVSIIARGRSLGATEQIPEKDRYNLSKTYLLNRIAIMLGGRAAEQLVFDDITTGAADDLKAASQLARRMICQWGMSEKLGPVHFRHGEEHLFLGKEMSQPKDFSELTARMIDTEVQRMTTGMYDRALDLLTNHQDKLQRLAEALLKHETLQDDEIDQLLEGESRRYEVVDEPESASVR